MASLQYVYIVAAECSHSRLALLRTTTLTLQLIYYLTVTAGNTTLQNTIMQIGSGVMQIFTNVY